MKPRPTLTFNRFIRILSIVIFTIAFFILSTSTIVRATPPPSGYTYYDNFEGAGIDTSLWNISDPGNVLSQSGGFLYADGPPNSVYGQLHATQTLNGDFEIVLQYSEFQSTTTDFIQNSPQISLEIQSQSSPGDFIYIFRGYYTNGHVILANGVVNGEWQFIYSDRDSATSSSGLLKISRSGSTITAHYNEGSGWVSLSSFPNAFTGEVTIAVSAHTGDNGIFHIASDGVYYKKRSSPKSLSHIMLMLLSF